MLCMKYELYNKGVASFGSVWLNNFLSPQENFGNFYLLPKIKIYGFQVIFFVFYTKKFHNLY